MSEDGYLEHRMIFCDNCRYDLTRAGSVPKYRLKLDQEKIPGPTGEYHVHVDKPLGEWVEHLHFCGVDCMVGWVTARRMNDERRRSC